MTWFLFAGDMLVMLFMTALVVWVFWRSSDETHRASAAIPLHDEAPAAPAGPAEPPEQPEEDA